MACEGFLSKRLRRFEQGRATPACLSQDARWLAARATRLGGPITTPRQARNVNHRHNTKREYDLLLHSGGRLAVLRPPSNCEMVSYTQQ